MTLAGTRPILQDELRQYELHHRARIAIKPGITGMWQVSGRSDITDYGKAYCKIANPTIVNNELNLGIGNADEGQSRNITHSFAEKLQKLMLGEEVEITLCDAQGATQKYKFTDTERMTFVLFGILYASRCNNFHGNVAARMPTILVGCFARWKVAAQENIGSSGDIEAQREIAVLFLKYTG